MLKRRSTVLLVPLFLAACATAGSNRGRIASSFDASGVTRVVLRAARVDDAIVEAAAGSDRITVSGQVTGGAEGYHPADPRWRETPATDWGLDFAAKRFGPVLVISTKNEISYIHHHYVVTNLSLRLPPSVELVRQARILNGNGQADLAPP